MQYSGQMSVDAIPTREVETGKEQSLLDRARAGDTAAYCVLCCEHETRLFRHALTLCRNAHVAEDLAQETLVEAWKSLGRFHGRCRFFTWLCAILLNRYRNCRRRRWWNWISAGPDSHEHDGAERIDEAELWPDQALDQREQSALLWACVQALPRKHREVVYLRFYVDDSIESIAEALDCSVGTVKSRLFNALEKLRGMKRLKDCNLELSKRHEDLC